MASAQRQADRLVRDLKIDWSHAAPTDALISVGSDSASNALNTFGLSATLDADIFDAVNRNTVDWAVDHATELLAMELAPIAGRTKVLAILILMINFHQATTHQTHIQATRCSMSYSVTDEIDSSDEGDSSDETDSTDEAE